MQELTFDDLTNDVVIELPSFGKSILVRPYLPSQRLEIHGHLLEFADEDEVDPGNLNAEKMKAYTKLAERIAAEVCYIGDEKAFKDNSDRRLARLGNEDFEAIINAAMGGGAEADKDFETRRKKSKRAKRK